MSKPYEGTISQYREELTQLEKLEATLKSPEVKTILAHIELQLDSIRARYSTIDTKKENSLHDLARLQGRELQVLTHLSMYENIPERKKVLAEKLQKLILLNNQSEDTGNSRSSISLVSDNIDDGGKQ